MNTERSRSMSASLLAGLLLVAVSAPPLRAADLGDLTRDISSARRATRDGKYIFDQVERITKAVTVKRADSLPTDNDNIILYSSSRCDRCDDARAHFERSGIAYVEHDVQRSKQGKADYQTLGSPGVPILLIGDQRMNGWSESRFKRLYADFKHLPEGAESDSPFAIGTVLTAKIDNVPIFESSSRDSKVVAHLKKGDEIVAMSQPVGDLIEVQGSATTGWVDARLIKAQED